MKKRFNLVYLLVGVVALSACGVSGAGADEEGEDSTESSVVNIGFQKFGTLNLLKEEGTLEERLADLKIDVEWTEFPAGPQLLEALNVGSLDFGHTGEAPPIFAQAADAELVYAGNAPASPKSEAIVIPEDSAITSVEELKGKKVALNKGSNVHYLLVKALEEANLTLDDIEVAYLPPADARTAFERGDVDAWVIWDPFLGAAEEDLNAKILRDGEGIVANREFLLAERSFAEEHADVVDIIFEELDEVERKVEADQPEAAAFFSPLIGVEEGVLEKVLQRREYGVTKVTDDVLAEQQVIADTFYELDLIPKELDIRDAVVEEVTN